MQSRADDTKASDILNNNVALPTLEEHTHSCIVSKRLRVSQTQHHQRKAADRRNMQPLPPEQDENRKCLRHHTEGQVHEHGILDSRGACEDAEKEALFSSRLCRISRHGGPWFRIEAAEESLIFTLRTAFPV